MFGVYEEPADERLAVETSETSRQLAVAGPARILVRLPNWVGDIVMALPAVQAVRVEWPGTHLVGMARSEHLELARCIAAFDEVVEAPGGAGIGLVTSTWSVARRLRSHRFDAAVVLAPSFEAALTAWFSGIPRRVGHATDRRRLLLTTTVLERLDCHRSEGYADLARALGAQVVLGTTTPILTLKDDDRAYADRFFAATGWPGDERPLFLNPAAAKTPRAWSADRFQILAETLVEHHSGLRVIVHEHAPFDVPAAWINHPAFAFARGASLTELAALIERCRLYVGNDSGPMHLAAALRVPTVTLYGPSIPGRTGPRSQPHIDHLAVSADFACSPCRERFFDECPTPPSSDGRPPCLQELTVERVRCEVERALGGARPSR